VAYHDDLLNTAVELLNKDDASLTQADLRRSVSTAYYALFHLLITETVAHWSRPDSRGALARMFEHSVMKKVSSRIANPKVFPFPGEDPAVVESLRQVALGFVQLQDLRHSADYDNTRFWTESEAHEVHDKACVGFATWDSIRHEKIAQDYLVSLLIKPRD
jgi:uncharacterized protein (UPF0332 family)